MTQTSLFDTVADSWMPQRIGPTRTRPPLPITLRDYQAQCKRISLQALSEGVHRQVAHLAVGLGKTIIFSDLLDEVPEPFPGCNRTLVLAHREELIDQGADKIRWLNPHLRVEVEMGSRRASPQADVVVASVATLGRHNKERPDGFSPRLLRLNPKEFKCIVIDECHHAPTASYIRILKHFGADQPDTHLLLWGCSATPKRTDGVGLEKLFDQIVFSMGIVEGIEQGFLTTLRAVRISTTTDLDGIKIQGGDWAEGELGDRINNDERNELIYHAWVDHIQEDRHSTLIFCANVKHIYDLVEVFRRNNVDARGLDGTTDKELRRKTIQGFREQRFPVLVNCQIATEGTDIPNIDAIIMARPTQSSVLYSQALGRGTRLSPGKVDCLVVDTVDASSGKNLMTVPSLFGLEPNFDPKGEDIMGVFRQMEQMVEENPLVVQATDIDHAQQIVSETFDPLASGTTDSIIHEASKLKWRKIDDRYWIEVPRQGSVEVTQDVLGKFDIRHHANGKAQTVRNRADPASALQAADAFIRETYPQSMPLLERDALWRMEPMSVNQVEFFRKHKMPVPTDERGKILINKGEATERIDAKLLTYRRHAKMRNKSKAKLNPRTENVQVGAIK